MSDLNIDQLQKELVDAENYLKTDVFHGAESGDQEINVRASQALRDSIDSAKKANILQQLGRQPLSSSVRLSHDSTSQVGVSTSTASAAADKENKSSPTSSSKYTDPSERERLINRLLMEHSARKSDSSMSTSMTRNYFSDIEPISKNQLSGRENEASSLKFSELAQTPAKDEVFQFPTPSSYDPGDDENDQESASHTNAESASVGNDSMLFFASDLPSTTFPSNRLDYQDNSSPRLRKEHESDPVDESPQAAYDPQLEFMETIRFTKPLDGFHGDSFVGRSDYSQQQKNRRNFLYDNNEDAEQGKDENFTSIGPAKLDESNSPNHSTAIGESSFAEKRHLKTKEMLLEEAEKEFRDSCKFSPTLFTKIYGRKYSRDGSPNRSYVDSRSREAELKHYMRAKSASPSRGRRLERSLSTSPSRSKSRQRYSEEQILFRIEEMNRIHENRLKERHVMKKEYEQLEMLNCTFKPNLSKGTESIVRQKALLETVPGILRGSRDEKSSYDVGESSASRSIEVSERLYKLAGVRASQQKWLEKEIQEARLSEYSFHPTINPITATKALENNYRPIHERVYELQRDKKRYLMGLKAAIDEEDKANFTFTPQIDARSKVMAEKKNNASYAFYANMDESVRREDLKPFQKDVGTRLMNEGQLIMKRKQQLLEEREKIIAEQMEKPFLSDGSRKLAEKNDLLRQSFLERQQIFEKKAKSNKHSLEEEFDSKLRDCFKPDIDPGSRKIVASKRPEQLLEGPEQRYQRMTYAALLEREKWRQEQEQRIYGSIPFQPTIDPLSRSLGRKHDIDELSENYRGKQIKELIRQKILAVENKNCTFQPKINDLSRHLLEKSDEYEDYANEYKHTGWNECPIADLASSREAKKPQSYSRINFAEPELMAQDIRLNLLKKEEKRRSELLAKEMKELQDCSFQPSIIRIPPHIKKVQAGNDDPIVIRGLGRHLELMHLSARKKDEALQREQEVFSVKNVEKYRRAEDGSTIIQSFRLHSPREDSSRGEKSSAIQSKPNISRSDMTSRLWSPVIR